MQMRSFVRAACLAQDGIPVAKAWSCAICLSDWCEECYKSTIKARERDAG